MREIKFRGQDIKTRKFVYGSLIDFSKLNNCPYFEIYSYNKETKEQNYYKVYNVGQYTGLKDVNDKEIYESDIVRFINKNCLVSFVENDCAFRIDVDSRTSTALRKAHSKDYEVIGNIYENPDLIKST